jgi:broad-specificity NMP kinase
MLLIFITGMSGTGKTTVKDELIRRGYTTYDTDDYGLTVWINKQTGQPYESNSNIQYGTPEFYFAFLWTLQTDKVLEKAKHAESECVFMCGVPGNWREVMPMFDIVFCLALDNETLKHRLLNRTNNNYGKAPHELSDIMEWNRTMATEAEGLGAKVIDSSQPVKEVVDTILKNLK